MGNSIYCTSRSKGDPDYPEPETPQKPQVSKEEEPPITTTTMTITTTTQPTGEQQQRPSLTNSTTITTVTTTTILPSSGDQSSSSSTSTSKPSLPALVVNSADRLSITDMSNHAIISGDKLSSIKSSARKRKKSLDDVTDSPSRNLQWKSYIAKDSLFSSPIRNFVKDIPEAVWIYSSQTLEEALEVMSHKRLSAIAVVNPENGLYFGFVSVIDILSKVAFSVKAVSAEEVRAAMRENLVKLKMTIGDLLTAKKPASKMMLIRSDTDLFTVMGHLAEGLDQLLVLSDDDVTTVSKWRQLYSGSNLTGSGEIKDDEASKTVFWDSNPVSAEGQVKPLKAHVFRQLDAIALFRKHHEQLGAIQGAKLNELDGGIGKRKVEGVQACDSVLISLRNMVFRSQESAPVLDDHDTVVGTLSVTDLRGLTPRSMEDILLPVAEFLRKTRHNISTPPVSPLREEEQTQNNNFNNKETNTALRDFKATEPDSSVPRSDQYEYYVMEGSDFGVRYGIRSRNGICSPHDTLGEVLVQVLKDKLSRLWLVENEKAVGEISTTKIIAAIYVDRLHPEIDEEEEEE